jgi:protein-S-isoprenylcysteine O-methyltransferase Ste14
MTPAIAAVLIVLATAAYGALHSWLASLPAKQLARRLFGPSADRFYRLAYNIVGAVTLLPLLAFVAWQPGRALYRVPPPFTWLFLAGQAAAAAIVVLGLLQTDPWHFLGARQLFEPAAGPSQLTTSGLYRYVRHPLYTAGFVFLWLTPLMTSTLFALYLGLSLYLYLGSLFEERRLVVEFGSAYQDYQRHVPRLVPGWPRRGPDSATPAAPST